VETNATGENPGADVGPTEVIVGVTIRLLQTLSIALAFVSIVSDSSRGVEDS